MAENQKKNRKKMSKSDKIVISVVVVVCVIAVGCYFLFIFNGGVFSDKKAKGQTKDTKPAVETQAPTEFTVTPCDKKEAAQFTEDLPGTWTSYTDEGIKYTYSFTKDGKVHYEKEGKKTVDFTYTFKDGMLTLTNKKMTYVYQCSRDAVGMMARTANGTWQSNISAIARKIPHFSGFIFIADDIMYMSDKCLCGEKTIADTDVKSIDGDWIGAVGDTVSFADDGSYTYVNHASTYVGAYVVDYKKQTLAITIDDKTNDHDKTQWGVEGRVLRIGRQYYFKMS